MNIKTKSSKKVTVQLRQRVDGKLKTKSFTVYDADIKELEEHIKKTI